ncbi:hypothetical protein HMPREF1248_0755 [Coriobacteriaceae bacterium BV3Ac1]|nr:hypothetical protein HMPREF1248_0755 [Coriobacteriaceae bacterium BV3Ac1]
MVNAPLKNILPKGSVFFDRLAVLNCRQCVNNDSKWICFVNFARKIFFCTLVSIECLSILV